MKRKRFKSQFISVTTIILEIERYSVTSSGRYWATDAGALDCQICNNDEDYDEDYENDDYDFDDDDDDDD